MDVMQMLAERRTYRRFLQNKQLPQDMIDDSQVGICLRLVIMEDSPRCSSGQFADIRSW